MPGKPTDIRIQACEHSSLTYQYRAPIKFGGRVVTDVLLVEVAVDVETRDGRRGRGHGAMPLGNAWAWPSGKLSSEQTLAAMAELSRRVDAAARELNAV